ncbi:MAG: hypothetical protein ACOCTI_07950 [Phycisphaeraceae bacterium]
MRVRHLLILLIAVIGCVWLAGSAVAQRGTGEERGIAQRAQRPPVETFQGELVSLHIEPCKHTTGPFEIGMHAIIRTEAGERNVHLGPAGIVLPLARQIPFGQPLNIDAFRTRRLPEGHAIARTIHFGDRTVRFRDASLRPVWAGSRNPRQQRAPGSLPALK